MAAGGYLFLLALLGQACGLRVHAPVQVSRPQSDYLAIRLPGRTAPALTMMGGKSRYGDDGSRLKGASLQDGVDDSLKKGFFSNFKFGTEVEVGPAQAKGKKGKRGAPRGMAGDNSDRGLGGNQAYRNTESGRLRGSSDLGQQIRQQKLEAYINSEEEATSNLVPRIIAGSALLSIFAGLAGVAVYYGVDGLVAAPTRM